LFQRRGTSDMISTSIPRACVPPHDIYPFCNTSLSTRTRADDLISRLTLDEKPTLLMARQSPKGNISRLGIPEYDWGGNCVHGVQSRCSPDGRCPTSYPNPNLMGSSFNRSVWRQMGSVIGVELRSLWLQGVGEAHENNLPHIGLDCWSPNINLVRDPRWGRNLETPSEDPLVCGAFGAEVTRGLQEGSDPRYLQAIVTLKHFDANSLEGDWGAHGELNRHTFSANISQHDLFSSYLPAFRRAVVDGGAKGVM
jgi:beta-D-xylosidase 4